MLQVCSCEKKKIVGNKIPEQPVYEELKKTSCTTDGHKKSFKDMLKYNLNQYDRVNISEAQTRTPMQQSVKGCLRTK